MAAQIPINNDAMANDLAFAKVLVDREQEVKNAHDGTWVLHPRLVSASMSVYNEHYNTKSNSRKKTGCSYFWNWFGSNTLGIITEERIRKILT